MPYCSFEPCDVGIIGAVDVPTVPHNPENPSDLFACVDFEKLGLPARGGVPPPPEWRCSLYYHHMVSLSPYSVSRDAVKNTVEMGARIMEQWNQAWDTCTIRVRLDPAIHEYVGADSQSRTLLQHIIASTHFAEEHYIDALSVASKAGCCFEDITENRDESV